MHIVATLVMAAGAIGFGLQYIGVIDVAPPLVWGGIAVGGMVVSVMTRRPSN